MSPDSLFETFGHIGHGKKTKRPVVEQAADHTYESEVDLMRDGKVVGRTTISWSVALESKGIGIIKLKPVVVPQTVILGEDRTTVRDPEIEIIVSESGVGELSLIPFEMEIQGGKTLVRFYGG